jgi:peroxiredoxin
MLKNFLRVLTILLALALAQAGEPRPASQVSIPLPDGKKINLQQYRGKVVLFVIFSLTCPDCIENLQMINKVQKDFGPQGFQAIGGAGDDNAQHQIGPFTQRYKINFPIGYLTKEQMIALADIGKERRPIAPIFLFIDKKNTVRFQYYGDHPFFKTAEGSTRSIVQGLLEGK